MDRLRQLLAPEEDDAFPAERSRRDWLVDWAIFVVAIAGGGGALASSIQHGLHGTLVAVDVILGVAGQSIGGQSEFYQTLWASGPAGDDVELHILRSKTVQHVKVRSMDRAAFLRVRTTS